MVAVKSFAAAAFIAGHGIEPVSIDRDARSFIFPDEAAPALREYRRVNLRLSEMFDGAIYGESAR
jgi:hypothetical protein